MTKIVSSIFLYFESRNIVSFMSCENEMSSLWLSESACSLESVGALMPNTTAYCDVNRMR